jgi:2-haloacid dehalogenase
MRKISAVSALAFIIAVGAWQRHRGGDPLVSPAERETLRDAPGDDFNPGDLSRSADLKMTAVSGRSGAPAGVKMLVFDVLGTVVDWRSLASAPVLAAKGVKESDRAAFAKAWVLAYARSVGDVRSGAAPWAIVDDLNRESLDGVLAQFHVSGVTDQDKDDLIMAWHRLAPWPDSVDGLARLNKEFAVAPLSNFNRQLLADLAQNEKLPWMKDFWSVERVQRYKPDPAVYNGAAAYYHLQPGEMMLVAAHQYDLEAAKALGMKTAYVRRSTEMEFEPDPPPPGKFDLDVKDLGELASRLGL